MSGQAMKGRIGAILCVWLFQSTLPVMAGEPPAVGCIDLNNLTGGWRTGEREILIRSSGNTGARLNLDAACPVFDEGVDLETLAPDGVACPSGRVFVRGGSITCPVIQMTALSESELADALHEWEARMQASVTLDVVKVRGQRQWRDVTGTTDYCVDSRFLRGWRRDGDGLVVDVSPRHHSGHRHYRVETIGKCSDLSSASSIRLASRNGGAAVCGYPGDKVLLSFDPLSSYTNREVASTDGPGSSCEIKRVAPFPSK